MVMHLVCGYWSVISKQRKCCFCSALDYMVPLQVSGVGQYRCHSKERSQ